MTPLRIGVLGAANIAPASILRPAARSADASVVAVAARNPQRAEGFAVEHTIPAVHESYASLLADDDIDAVYIPLPNSMHAEWTTKSLQAGKHVLVEKPFANNTLEAEQVAEVARGVDRVCMEGYHYRYHGFFAKAAELLPRIGRIRHAEARFDVTITDRSNIRYDYALGGGAMMDLGCYPLHLFRSLLGGEPTVLEASHRPADDPRVDEALTARLRFGDVDATLHCSLLEEAESTVAVFTGEHGELRLDGFVKPHEGNSIELVVDGEREQFSVPTETTSYDAQLAVFVAAVRDGAPVLTDIDDSRAMMRSIDAIYVAAGLPLRGDSLS